MSTQVAIQLFEELGRKTEEVARLADGSPDGDDSSYCHCPLIIIVILH